MLKNFQVIELISSKTKALMTVYCNKLKFNIYTAVDLNYAAHVQLLMDPNGKCFAIRACEKDAPNAVAFSRLPMQNSTLSSCVFPQPSSKFAMQWVGKTRPSIIASPVSCSMTIRLSFSTSRMLTSTPSLPAKARILMRKNAKAMTNN